LNWLTDTEGIDHEQPQRSYSAGRDSNSPMQQWERHYRVMKSPPSAIADWWTVSSWKKNLFAPLFHELEGKLVVDVGCGTAARIAAIVPIETYKYRYVGIDSSLDALKRAAVNMPGGTFVRADLGGFQLKSGMADVLLCLGVLMYFDDCIAILERFLEILKPGGFLLLHEQIQRRSWSHAIRHLFPIPPDVFPSAHGVGRQELCNYLARRGTVVHAHLAGSPLRRLSMKILDASPLDGIRPLATLCDSCWCATAGRVWPAVGASELQILFRKN
jgi:SAM-dependent methyltransferase